MSKFHKADHRHKWVFSQETFWSEHGGDYCLVWCEVCDQGPNSEYRDEFPLEIARALADFHAPEPLEAS